MFLLYNFVTDFCIHCTNFIFQFYVTYNKNLLKTLSFGRLFTKNRRKRGHSVTVKHSAVILKYFSVILKYFSVILKYFSVILKYFSVILKYFSVILSEAKNPSLLIKNTDSSLRSE